MFKKNSKHTAFAFALVMTALSLTTAGCDAEYFEFSDPWGWKTTSARVRN